MLSKLKTYIADLTSAASKADSTVVTLLGLVTAHPILVGGLCLASALIGHVL